MADNSTIALREKLMERAFELISQKTWRAFQLRDLVQDDTSLEDISACFSDKGALLEVFSQTIGTRLEKIPFSFSQEEGVQERLFDVIMARLDLLAPYQKACRDIVTSHQENPLEAIAPLLGLQDQVDAMLALTGKDAFPPFFATAMLGVFGVILTQWALDRDPQMDATMAFVHKTLGNVCPLFRLD